MSVPSRQRKDMTDPEAEKENIKMKKSNAILKDENLQRKRGTSAGEKIEKKKKKINPMRSKTQNSKNQLEKKKGKSKIIQLGKKKEESTKNNLAKQSKGNSETKRKTNKVL